MSKDQESLSRDLASGVLGLLPFGSVFELVSSRLITAVQAEHQRNTSKAMAATERASGLSRWDLQERIADNPNLVPLLTHVLFTAGMTGFDDVLESMGQVLGDAVRDPTSADDAAVVLTAMAPLRGHHTKVLRVLTRDRPLHGAEGEEPKKVHWSIPTISPEAGLSEDISGLCVAGLVNAGLVRTLMTFDRPGYEITELGKTVLEAIEARQQAKTRRS